MNLLNKSLNIEKSLIKIAPNWGYFFRTVGNPRQGCIPKDNPLGNVLHTGIRGRVKKGLVDGARRLYNASRCTGDCISTVDCFLHTEKVASSTLASPTTRQQCITEIAHLTSEHFFCRRFAKILPNFFWQFSKLLFFNTI